MKEAFELKSEFPVNPSTIYNAWLDSSGHTKMTGADADFSNREGEDFSAWEGYITGKNIRLVQDKMIKQSWRTSDFNETDADSEISIEFQETAEGCELILKHENIPEGQPDYKQGWQDHYFNPMKVYFNDLQKR